jgi:hypothetical protein
MHLLIDTQPVALISFEVRSDKRRKSESLARPPHRLQKNGTGSLTISYSTPRYSSVSFELLMSYALYWFVIPHVHRSILIELR